MAHRSALVARWLRPTRLLSRGCTGRSTANHIPGHSDRSLVQAGLLMRGRRSAIASSIQGGWPISRVVRELPPRVQGITELTGRYVELHCHSAFSLHEGTSLPQELVMQAKRLGYQA